MSDRNSYSLLIRFFSVVLVFSLSAFNAKAASTAWQDVGGGKVRLVASLDPRTNDVLGVVEVKLENGWSTYWRYPGSAGIPPRFDFSGSQNFVAGEIEFPVPKVLTSNSMKYAGYKSQVSFPFKGKLLTNNTGEIKLDLTIGVCSDICVPAKAAMSIPARELFKSNPRALQTISLARLGLPKQVAADRIISVENNQNEALIITVAHDKKFGQPDLFVEGPADWYLMPAKFMEQDGETASFSLDLSSAPKDIDPLDTKLRYTLVSGSTGVEIER